MKSIYVKAQQKEHTIMQRCHQTLLKLFGTSKYIEEKMSFGKYWRFDRLFYSSLEKLNWNFHVIFVTLSLEQSAG